MLRKGEFMKTHPEVRMGMMAYDTSGEKMGVIEKIGDDSITIEKGRIFHHDVNFSYDAIEDVREDQIIIREGRENLERENLEEERNVNLSEENLEGEYEQGRSEREEQDRFRAESGWEEREGPRSESNIGEPSRGAQIWDETKRAAGIAEAGYREEFREEEEVRIPVREEEVEVSKRPVVKEEIRAKKDEWTEAEDVSGAARKEEVKGEPGRSVEKK